MPDADLTSPTYPVGLRLAGRRVVMVGGGHVAQRRLPGLIAAGARVEVVSPDVTPTVEGYAGSGEIVWRRRRFEPADLDGAWYVLAATDDAGVNDAVSAAAEERHTFCVRADDAERGSAWTPATGRHGEVVVAVLGDRRPHRDPRRTAELRDAILDALERGDLAAHAVKADVESEPHVVLVGGGPGDPGLISVAGRDALRTAEVVVADRLGPRELLGELPADVEVIDVAKLPRGRAAAQQHINDVLVERARAGKRVVRLKGGDSFVFGRGYEEVLALREAGIAVRVVPGITSPLSVPALAGIPVTHRGVTHEFTVVSGHVPPDHPDSLVEWGALARLRGTVVLMMAVQNAGAIAGRLVAEGRPAQTPVAVICDGSLPTERTVRTTLGALGETIEADGVRPPAIIVIGDVVGL